MDEQDQNEEFNDSKLFKVLDYHYNLTTLHIKLALTPNQKNITGYNCFIINQFKRI